ncbi:MAG: hypothetical protein CM15mV50_280 [uncultured marine virus]|nr:MAG: hypothetical protein CM15mV50_280 [uncultured marine virus]
MEVMLQGIELYSGHGNWGIYNSDTVADALEFRDDSAGATRMMINSSGNVGIGTTNPAFTNGSGLEIQRDGIATLRIEDTGSSGKPLEIFADDATGYHIKGLGSGMPLTFGTVNAERMRIDTSGHLCVNTTSAINSAHTFEGYSSR